MNGRKFVRTKQFFEEDFVEGYAEVPENGNPAGIDADKARQIGKPLDRYDGYDKASGTAEYTFDVQLRGMLHAKTLRCPHPHAKLVSIDTSRAEALPGVAAVIHHGNVPDIPWYSDSKLFDTHLRYAGDEVACVAATSERLAEQALKLIDVTYDVLPFGVDAEKIVGDQAPLFHEDGVLAYRPWIYERGDVENGFSEADAVVEGTYTTQVAVHNPTEPHGSVAVWDGKRLTVYDSTQGVYAVRETVADKLGIPQSDVRVITRYMGGGFGSKLATGKYTVMAALLAQRTGRPVRIALDRTEMNLAVGNRPDSFQHLKAGAKKDGTLTAMSLEAIGSSGAYQAWAGCNFPMIGTYKCANVHTDMRSVFTNLGPARPFRAPGRPQGTFALDSILDDLAEKIGMDPLEFRLKNNAEIDQFYNQPYTSKKLKECYEQGAKAFGWKKKWRSANSDPGPVKRGVGLATQIWSGGGGPPAGVTVKLNGDGSASVIAGSQDLGTGTYTFLSQVVAEGLEIPPDWVRVTLGDTATGPQCPLSGGSQTAPSVAPAAWDAVMQVRQVLISGYAALEEIKESDVIYQEGVLSHKNDPSKRMSVPEVMDKLDSGTIVRTGYRAANKEGYTIQSFGVQFAEVEVNVRTGRVRVIRIVAAHDIGRTLNRKLLENQFHGGIIQGISFALLEQRVVDRGTGRVLTTNLHDYKLPTIYDAPEIEVITLDPKDTIANSLGVKGIGEPPIIPTAGAIANAVKNATGVRIRSLPMTPQRVLAELTAASKGGRR
ncbi:MAG: xanthine dehydrogenase family protein molybdopterin-binding subunit [bacterium]